jgi:PAS domain-containing protein
MSKQYLSIRALRCATIALFLAAGLEGLKQVVFPNLSAGRSRIPAILVCVFAVLSLTLESLLSGKVKQETFSTNIIQGLPEIACIFDDAGKFKPWNSNLQAALGHTAEEITKLTAFDTFAEKQRDLSLLSAPGKAN